MTVSVCDGITVSQAQVGVKPSPLGVAPKGGKGRAGSASVSPKEHLQPSEVSALNHGSQAAEPSHTTSAKHSRLCEEQTFVDAESLQLSRKNWGLAAGHVPDSRGFPKREIGFPAGLYRSRLESWSFSDCGVGIAIPKMQSSLSMKLVKPIQQRRGRGEREEIRAWALCSDIADLQFSFCHLVTACVLEQRA